MFGFLGPPAGLPRFMSNLMIVLRDTYADTDLPCFLLQTRDAGGNALVKNFTPLELNFGNKPRAPEELCNSCDRGKTGLCRLVVRYLPPRIYRIGLE